MTYVEFDCYGIVVRVTALSSHWVASILRSRTVTQPRSVSRLSPKAATCIFYRCKSSAVPSDKRRSDNRARIRSRAQEARLSGRPEPRNSGSPGSFMQRPSGRQEKQTKDLPEVVRAAWIVRHCLCLVPGPHVTHMSPRQRPPEPQLILHPSTVDQTT